MENLTLSEIHALKNALVRKITNLTRVISNTESEEKKKTLIEKQMVLIKEFRALAEMAAKKSI